MSRYGTAHDGEGVGGMYLGLCGRFGGSFGFVSCEAVWWVFTVVVAVIACLAFRHGGVGFVECLGLGRDHWAFHSAPSRGKVDMSEHKMKSHCS